MKTLAIIPARYASTRFPGKPLALLGRKPVIQWVWERVSAVETVTDVVVATDDNRIFDAVQACCGEVLQSMESEGRRYDIAINVQGDEPFVNARELETLTGLFADPAVEIASLMCPINTLEELLSPNNVKVVCNQQGDALYFSRQPIPYVRGTEQEQWLQHASYHKHVGIYAFRTETLMELVRLPQSTLERSESLEQLRWLDNGYAVRMGIADHANIGIDTPEDLALAEKMVNGEE